jgi:hypothetical protein
MAETLEGTGYTPEEQAQWDVIDAAEEVIRSAVAQTPAGVEIQLWTALTLFMSTRAEDEATIRGDLETINEMDGKQDWNIRLLISALRSVRAMGGKA